MKSKVSGLVILLALGLAVLLSACSTVFPRESVAVPVVNSQGQTNMVVLPNGTTIGPAVPAVQETSKLFGPWGELAAGLVGLSAAAYAKISNQRELAKHIAET